MTLIVSLRIPDGIVIAGDSLSTMMGALQVVGEAHVKCPNCGHEHDTDRIPLTNIPFPTTTYSFAQKIFPFCNDFGVGVFGSSNIGGKTVFFIIRELEQQLEENGDLPTTITEASRKIGERLQKLFEDNIPNIDELQDDFTIGGVQVVGYDNNDENGDKIPKTIEVLIGKHVNYSEHIGIDCNCSGQDRVVKAIWALYEENPGDKAEYQVFSLEDAIHYVEFLIGTTSQFQQFSRTIPQVGGDIDIALITPFDGFCWIKQKELGKTVGGRYEQNKKKI